MLINHSCKDLKCPCCKKEFWTPYYHGGSIEHYNVIRNIECYIARYKEGQDVLRDLANIDGNFCNVKDLTYEVGIEIFECAIKALRMKSENKMADDLESRSEEIKWYYNEVTYQYIEEKLDEIKKLVSRIIR